MRNLFLLLVSLFSFWQQQHVVCHAWVLPSSVSSSRDIRSSLYAETTTSSASSSSSLTIVPNSGQPQDLQRAAAFMVDAFWLGTPRQQIHNTDDDDSNTPVSESARTALMNHQFTDFTEKYGERMGQRLCESILLEAHDTDTDNSLLGLVGLEVTLLQQTIDSYSLLSTTVAEQVLQSAVASLGPKQRRQFKSATAPEIATNLLLLGKEDESMMTACATLVNLAVSPHARRRGVAKALCLALEDVILQQQQQQQQQSSNSDYTISKLLLQVEADNTAARALYEECLGYELLATLPRATAMRANAATGEFESLDNVESLILQKTIGG